ncbi:MAG: cytolethal distending toxin subunit B family protein [Helicobacter sp.]|nr:cytolethal distending toxin subunit B family protein [Helicobacter sp.]
MKKIFISYLITIGIAFSNIEDYNIGTWNIQGSSQLTESKWNVSIRQLISGVNAVNILMVQEAGSIPSTAVRTGRMVQPGGTPIEEFTWDLGTISRPRLVYIYHSPIDVGARRVNLSIVSDRRADDIIIIQQDTIAPDVTRPAIGIRIGNDVFFSIHALANGGGDAAAIVTAIHDYFMEMPNINWMIAGDFNREPTDLLRGLPARVEQNLRIVAPNFATHTSGARGGENRILDYGIVGRTVTGGRRPLLPSITALLMSSVVRSYISSDHFPVRFGKL